MGAKQVHVFDRTADETISWIQEKGTLLAAEDYGHDLDTIQTLIQKHQGFEADLAAVKEQVILINYKILFMLLIIFIFRWNVLYKKLVGYQPCFRTLKITLKLNKKKLLMLGPHYLKMQVKEKAN
jgi:hypothetical protein